MSQRALLIVAVVLMLLGAGVIVGADLYAHTTGVASVRLAPGAGVGPRHGHHFPPGFLGPGARPRPSAPPPT